jgi:hypothetical protein
MISGDGLFTSQKLSTSLINPIVAWLDNRTTFEIHGKFVLEIGRFKIRADKM